MQYWITQSGSQSGPHSVEELLKLRPSSQDLIWSTGWTEWKPLAEVDDLKTLIPPPMAIQPPHIPQAAQKPLSKPTETQKPKSKSGVGVLGVLGIGLLGVLLLVGLFTILNQGKATVEAAASEMPVYSQEDLERERRQTQIEETRRSIYNRVTIDIEGGESKFFGGIKNARFRVYNKTDFDVDQVTVKVTYILASGEVYQTEEVPLGAIAQGESALGFAPDSKRGETFKVELSYISDNELGEIQL